MTGHQCNKDNVQFVPQQQQQSHTDNIAGEVVWRLMNKIENNEIKEVQQYSKEVQPITSSSSITGPLVQIYNDGTKWNTIANAITANKRGYFQWYKSCHKNRW